MNIIHLDSPFGPMSPSIATVGFFDGVHRGHQQLIGQMVHAAHEAGLTSTVVTFSPHPREVLQPGFRARLLTTLDMKLRLICELGADLCVVVPFTRELSAMSARDFMSHVLKEQLGVVRLIVGYDHRFGHNREEQFADYRRYGLELGLDVERAAAFSLDSVNISSSMVRSLLTSGDVETATRCLGRPYELCGTVVSGFHEGRKLGFPTANLDTSRLHQLIPAPGVYAVWASVDDAPPLRAMLNIGTRPTFDGRQLTVETHILDFEADLYGHRLTLTFARRIREERRFDSPTALAVQLRADRQHVIVALDDSAVHPLHPSNPSTTP